MPAKRRRAKGRRSITSRAREIYCANPGAIDGNLILDPDLADELGRMTLVSYPDLSDLIEQLTENRV